MSTNANANANKFANIHSLCSITKLSHANLQATFHSPATPADLILVAEYLLISIQFRKRERLLDSDDLGEFAKEADYIRSLGGEALIGLMACPTRKAGSYKGRCESTIIHWEFSGGKDKLTISRREQMSKYRFKATMPNGSPVPYAYHWTSTKGVNIAAR